MKLIEGMKQVKDLKKKADDLRSKLGVYCANLSVETPTYENQAETVSGWLQSHQDIMREIERLTLAIQRTNLATEVTIEVGGVQVTKPIASWILRRRDLALLEHNAWSMLTDRNLKEGVTKNSAGENVDVKIVRYYNPAIRDTKREQFRSEPSRIDATLEVVNAVTDLIE